MVGCIQLHGQRTVELLPGNYKQAGYYTSPNTNFPHHSTQPHHQGIPFPPSKRLPTQPTFSVGVSALSLMRWDPTEQRAVLQRARPLPFTTWQRISTFLDARPRYRGFGVAGGQAKVCFSCACSLLHQGRHSADGMSIHTFYLPMNRRIW